MHSVIVQAGISHQVCTISPRWTSLFCMMAIFKYAECSLKYWSVAIIHDIALQDFLLHAKPCRSWMGKCSRWRFIHADRFLKHLHQRSIAQAAASGITINFPEKTSPFLNPKLLQNAMLGTQWRLEPLSIKVLYNLTDKWLQLYDLIITAQEIQSIPSNDPSMSIDKNPW